MAVNRVMFTITGLPRSRTAWFAAFMTASGYPCLHEAIDGCNSLDEYKNKIKYISDSTTALGLIEQPYDRPTLVIHRKEKIAGQEVFYEKLNGIKGLHVDFEDIDKRIVEIFKFLTGNDINMSVYRLFKDLKIETLIEYNEQSIKNLLEGL